MASAVPRRATVIVLGLALLALTIFVWERDPFVFVPLLLFDAFMGLMLVSGWRRIAQDQKDAAALARLRATRPPPERHRLDGANRSNG